MQVRGLIAIQPLPPKLRAIYQRKNNPFCLGGVSSFFPLIISKLPAQKRDCQILTSFLLAWALFDVIYAGTNSTKLSSDIPYRSIYATLCLDSTVVKAEN